MSNENVPRCDSCKWWQWNRDQATENDDPDYEAEKPGHSACALSWQEGSKFSAEGRFCTPVILTDPDFGCVQWEPKQ